MLHILAFKRTEMRERERKKMVVWESRNERKKDGMRKLKREIERECVNGRERERWWYEKVKMRERKMMVRESYRERERERWRLQRTQNRLFFILIRGAKTQKCIFLKQIRWKLFFKKWANPGLFFVYFWSFQTNITIFTTNICEKMSIQYTVLGFEPTTFGTWVSSHNH